MSLWENPDKFLPERFLTWKENAYNFIPQGGGDHHSHHRCAGEWVAIEMLKVAIIFLVEKMVYEVPKQDLIIDKTRFPAIPKSRMLINNARRVG